MKRLTLRASVTFTSACLIWKDQSSFYQELLGFELTMMYGDQAAFLLAGGYSHHIGLNTWHSLNSPPAQERQKDYTAQLFFIQRGKTLRESSTPF